MTELTEEDYRRYVTARLNTARQLREKAANVLAAVLTSSDQVTELDLARYTRARESVVLWEIVAGERGFGRGRTIMERVPKVRAWLQENIDRAARARRTPEPGLAFWRDSYCLAEQGQVIRQLEDYAVRNFLACNSKREEAQ